METKPEYPILPFKIQKMIEIIMKNKLLNFKDTLNYLYTSELYENLFKGSTKLWYLSSQSL